MFAAALTFALLSAFARGNAVAQTAGAVPNGVGLADCTLVSAQEVGTLLGSDVEDADETSRRGGICSFTSRSVTADGNVSYAVVTAAQVAARRPYFALLARRCGGVARAAPRALVCTSYGALAKARNVADYYAARAAGADPVDDLGQHASSNGSALYVLSGTAVVEVAVRREDTFDLDRSETLARMLLARLHDRVDGTLHPASGG